MIKFKVVRWRNLLSTGSQFTEIKLDKSHTTLILGTNGSGKSTIADSICYGLFNKPFRNINKPQLVNAVNQKQLVVEIEFDIGTKEYKVIRGIKPNIFEIYLNGTLLNQDAASRDYQKYLEEHVLKLNYKSFTQIVILGSAAFTPFMQLTAATRREVIEDLLDIKIFSTMNEVLKNKFADLKSKVQNVDNDIELTKQKVNIQQSYIKTIEDSQHTKVAGIQNRIRESHIGINKITNELNTVTTTIKLLNESISDATLKRKEYQSVTDLIKKLNTRIQLQQKHIDFYSENDTCPTCNQLLDEELKSDAIQGHGTKIDEITSALDELKSRIDIINTRLQEVIDIESQISINNTSIIELNSRLTAAMMYHQKLENELTTQVSDKGNIEDETKKLEILTNDIVDLSNQKSTLSEDRYYLDVAGVLLKDSGIKTTIIKQYIPIINKLVNKYLHTMDFYVSFELDETFNETIKSRYRDEFSYASFSEGEKARIDIAILLAFRSIAKLKNTANTNLLLMDEVFDSSLDLAGADFVMNLLNTLSGDTNVFVISHKDSLFDKFHSIIRFEKKNNFSIMV